VIDDDCVREAVTEKERDCDGERENVSDEEREMVELAAFDDETLWLRVVEAEPVGEEKRLREIDGLAL
jgi:hypothetical protein